MDHAPETSPLALPQSRPWGRVFVRRVGLGIAGFALLVLLDWQPSLGLLRGLLPGMVLKPLAALGFLLAGLVLANEARRVPWPAVSVLLSVAIAVAGAASLHADLAGVALASDRWFPDPEAAITSGIAGRMSPLTACGLLLLGLLGALRLDGACLRLRHGLALLVLGIAMFTLAAYGQQVGDAAFLPVPLLAAGLFLAAALAWLAVLPARGLLHVVHSTGIGGLVSRRLLLPALLLPGLLGVLARLAGSRAGWSAITVASIQALATGALLAWMIWWVATLLERLQRQRDEVRVLHDESHTDALTGLPNRRAFDEAIAVLGQGRRGHDHGGSLLLLDLDRFKDYNDRFGHQAGDAVLRQVGALLRHAVRPSDLPARYGGEEFAVLLPEAGIEEAMQVAERIVRAFRAVAWPGRAVTISVGAAALAGSESADALVGRADAALYAAKAAGRDRVVQAAAPAQPAPA